MLDARVQPLANIKEILVLNSLKLVYKQGKRTKLVKIKFTFNSVCMLSVITVLFLARAALTDSSTALVTAARIAACRFLADWGLLSAV